MKNFFKGISFSSISAGALAAVTSFLLSAKIGIAGSVIGVAAGSIVSAVSTQVYKNVLKASGEKLQNAVPFASNDREDEKKDGGDETAVLDATERLTEGDGERTEVMSASDDASKTASMPAVSGRVISSAQADGDETSVFPRQGAFRPKSSPQGQIQHAGSRRSLNAWLHGKHAPIVIAFVSALVGVGVSAGLILAFTGGHGTDTVVRDVVHEKVVPSHDDDSDSGYDDGTGVTPNNGAQDSDSGTTGGTTSGRDAGKKTDNSSNGSGNTSSGGSGSSSTDSGVSTGKTESSTDSDSASNDSTSNGNGAGQTDNGSSTSQNGSTSSNTDSTSGGTQSGSGTSGVSGTAGSGTGAAN